MFFALFICLCSLILASPASATILSSRRPASPQHVNLWMLEARTRALQASRFAQTSPLVLQDSTTGFASEPPAGYLEFPEQFFEQPIDHTNSSHGTFKQRYWINTRHYKPGSGGPVIVIDGGETSGVDRIPFLDTGIAEILANATGGVAVVLEHRYYGTYIQYCLPCPLFKVISCTIGTSIPVPDFSTDNLR